VETKGIVPPDFTGPHQFPQSFVVNKLVLATQSARVGQRGGMVFNLKTRNTVLATDSLQMIIPANSHSCLATLECRVDNILSASCVVSTVTLNTVNYKVYTLTMP
jgi:hypothetical protein